MISIVDISKPMSSMTFKSTPFLQNQGFLNWGSHVQSMPGTPALLKHTHKPNPRNQTAHITSIYRPLPSFPEIHMGRTRGEILNSNLTTSKISGGKFMKMISVTILNWDKFNPRNDRANYAWFRFQNDFFQSQNLFGMSDAQIILFMVCLCEASKKNKSTIDINIEYVATIRKLSIEKINQGFRELVKRGVITTAESRQEAGQEPSLLLATNERTNDTNDTRHLTIVENFEEFYALYPKKVAKAAAKRVYLKIANENDHDKIMEALNRYRLHLLKEKTEAKFIRHPTTFLNNLGDWDHDDAGKTESFSQDEHSNKISVAVKKYGYTGGAEARLFIGEDAWAQVKKLGGWAHICRLPQNKFTEILGEK